MLRKLSPTVKGLQVCICVGKTVSLKSLKSVARSQEVAQQNYPSPMKMTQGCKAKHSRKNIKQMKQDCSKMRTDNVHSRTHKITNYIYVSLAAVKLQIHHNNAFR